MAEIHSFIYGIKQYNLVLVTEEVSLLCPAESNGSLRFIAKVMSPMGGISRKQFSRSTKTASL